MPDRPTRAVECDPDPAPPLPDLAVNVIDVARQAIAAGDGTDALRATVAQYDGAKRRRNPDWEPPIDTTAMSDISDTDDDSTDSKDNSDIPEELTREEYEQIQADPVLTVDDVMGASE